MALTHEEFSIELSSTSTEMQSDCFKAYYDKVCNQIVGRYAAYHETDSESESDSDSDEFVRRNKKDSDFDTSKNPTNPFETIDFVSKLNITGSKSKRKNKVLLNDGKKPKKPRNIANSIKQKKQSKAEQSLQLSRKLIEIPPETPYDRSYWLDSLHIDLALESMQVQFPHVKILTLGLQAHYLIGHKGFPFNFENTPNLIIVLWHNNHWVTATNIDTGKSKLRLLTTENSPVFLYDSFSSVTYINSLLLTLNTMFPDKASYIVHQATIIHKQVSVNDCGLFALAYVAALC